MRAVTTGSDHRIDGEVLDVVGVGFGPANLALAIAIEEHNESCDPGLQVRAAFVERQPQFGWHPGMLLEGATMQIAFPKDLATFRNPTSRYSFFAYLHARQRLVDFVNHQTFFPTRREFHDYLGWAASTVDADVRYDTTVTDVRRVGDGAEEFEVRTATGELLRTRAVVLGLGLRPVLPEWATPSSRCFHNHQFLHRVAELPAPKHQRFVVLGAGQSAAEVVQYLHTNFPAAEVHNVFSRYGYSPADDSPYANRIFDPSAVDELYGAPQAERDRLLALHRGTNYSVVDIELINELYAAEYRERVDGRRRLFMRRSSTIESMTEDEGGVEVRVRSNLDGLTDSLRCDAVVFATGFEAASLGEVLQAGLCPTAAAPLRISRDYRLDTEAYGPVGVYLQGGTERTHGLTSSLLSNVAVRSGEILTSVLAGREATRSRQLAGRAL
ncbi:lysine N(6)-hydroxylase/L-ornithine N(5)-oxygenase family protein [Rhodococcus sp. D2-41]|uniref:lysine N(6)-hydroxylase/L-ornithine N(5)-oxygenase family protein n=1 Tax=Speluncibacter jeojiensis TaxID=2710754 RepID=UPI0038518934|nr:lysine N(6)-hydroxylase/L-ornithine N(5)-oxygenase family protein [Rhodococcus sp. D2-41]